MNIDHEMIQAGQLFWPAFFVALAVGILPKKNGFGKNDSGKNGSNKIVLFRIILCRKNLRRFFNLTAAGRLRRVKLRYDPTTVEERKAPCPGIR
jgi:hypothetical protein